MNIKVNVALVKNQRVKGSATVVFDDCLKVRDIVILTKNDTGELYISMPFKTLKNGNKISIAYPLNPEFRAELQKAILDEYMKLVEQENKTGNENSPETEASVATDLDDSAEEE